MLTEHEITSDALDWLVSSPDANPIKNLWSYMK